MTRELKVELVTILQNKEMRRTNTIAKLNKRITRYIEDDLDLDNDIIRRFPGVLLTIHVCIFQASKTYLHTRVDFQRSHRCIYTKNHYSS